MNPHLGDMLSAAARSFDGQLQIHKYLPCLSDVIIRPNQLSLGIQGHLAGDKSQFRRGCDDDLRDR